MKALVIGATGKDLVTKLIEDTDFQEIHVFVRREPQIKSEKVIAHIVDFEKPETWKYLVKGDVAFSCMGTTLKDAGSKEAQYKIDFEYQYRFAEMAKENGVEDFILVSAYGAHPQSRIFYSKIKGELEEAIKALHFNKLTIFKPGMLKRKGTKRALEYIGSGIIELANKLGFLKQQKPLPTATLAQAMINAAKIKSNGYSTIQLRAIFDFARKGHLY